MTKQFCLIFFLLSACVQTTGSSGAWQVYAVCLADSPFGERLIQAKADVIEVSANEFSGEIYNSLGQSGTIKASLSGNDLTSTVNWRGGSTTRAVLKLTPDSTSYIGIDSLGCRLTVQR